MKGKEKLLLLLLIIVVISIILTACGKEYCSNHYPCVDNDSTSFIQTANIDTIYIPMPADTAYIKIPADCKDQEVIYKDGKTEYKIVIKDKILNVYRFTVKDSLRVIYAYKNTEEFKKLTEIKYIEVVKYKVPKWCYCSLLINILLFIWVTRRFWVGLIKRIKFPV